MAAKIAAVPDEPEEPARPPAFFDDEALAAAMAEEVPHAEHDEHDEHDHAETPPPPRLINYQPDLVALQGAHGDPTIWAAEFAGLVHAITGSYLDGEIIANWLGNFSRQVEVRANRAALFQIANTAMPTHVDGDPALALLSFRDEIAASFRRPAGVA